MIYIVFQVIIILQFPVAFLINTENIYQKAKEDK